MPIQQFNQSMIESVCTSNSSTNFDKLSQVNSIFSVQNVILLILAGLVLMMLFYGAAKKRHSDFFWSVVILLTMAVISILILSLAFPIIPYHFSWQP